MYTENFLFYFTAKFIINFIMFGDKLEQFDNLSNIISGDRNL